MSATRSPIDSDKLAARMISRVSDGHDRVLIADLHGSSEAQDSYSVINCGGLGRIRKFHHFGFHADLHDMIENRRTKAFLCQRLINEPVTYTQVFQLAGCTWRCWYCYVDEDRLSGNPRVGRWLSAKELIALYLDQQHPPTVVDLSGGQPDLVSQWPIQILKELDNQSGGERKHVRSEDNLTGPTITDVCSKEDLDYLSNSGHYTRIGCFKGFNEASFQLNTRALPELYSRQFACAKAVVQAGIPFFSYVTLTCLDTRELTRSMADFVDRLQAVHPNLPLRVVPLTVTPASTWSRRDNAGFADHRLREREAVNAWSQEIVRRYAPIERDVDIRLVTLGN